MVRCSAWRNQPSRMMTRTLSMRACARRTSHGDSVWPRCSSYPPSISGSSPPRTGYRHLAGTASAPESARAMPPARAGAADVRGPANRPIQPSCQLHADRRKVFVTGAPAPQNILDLPPPPATRSEQLTLAELGPVRPGADGASRALARSLQSIVRANVTPSEDDAEASLVARGRSRAKHNPRSELGRRPLTPRV